MNDLPTLSASKIIMFKTCPKQFYYRYVEYIPEQPTVHAMFGTSLHKAIEMKYREGTNPNITFQATLQEEQQKYGNQTVRGEEYFSKYFKIFSKAIAELTWDLQPKELEFRFELPFPNKESPICIINGIIDVVDERGWVVDHKSSKEVPAQLKLDNDPQFIIYYWAYTQIYGKPPDKMFWHHLRTGKFLESNVANEYEFKLQRLTTDIEAMLSNQNYHRITMNKDVCLLYCSYLDRCFK